MPKEKITLTLRATNLKNVAGLFKGTSDPYAVVSFVSPQQKEQPRILGKTEVVRNSLSPQWTAYFVFDYELGKETHINVAVIDECPKARDKPMGSACFEIGEILGSRGSIKAKKLKKGGILYAHVTKTLSESSGQLALSLRGVNLKKMDTFSKSDPFFELCRTYPNGDSWAPVYRSRHVKDDLNPVWDPVTLDANQVCDGNLDKKLRVAIFDYERSGKHQSMGSFDATVKELIAAAQDGNYFFPIKNKGEIFGGISIDQCKIVTANTGKTQEIVDIPVIASVDPPEAEPMDPVPTREFDAMNLDVGVTATSARPTFVDYIQGGCELSLSVAIDFTRSNGDPRVPGTLHHFSRDGQMNSYEKAISAVGGILSKYDSNQRFPVWGFGAKFEGVVQNCFQVGGKKEVQGVKGILNAYKKVFGTGLVMSGPTVFENVIQKAASEAKSRHTVNKLAYTVLLILSDGSEVDIEATKKALVEAADAPLSIVIVGIGGSDFSSMRFLDTFGQSSHLSRDIVQFVEFRAHESDRSSLAAATLEEIPDQLVQFFFSRGIMPNPPIRDICTFEIKVDSYDDVEDIDISHELRASGSIILDQAEDYFDEGDEDGARREFESPTSSAIHILD